MSQPHSSDPLPSVILVAPHSRVDKRPARRKVSWPGGEIPWMKIAVGGSVAWMAVILVIGLCFFMRGDRQPIDEGGLPPVPALKPVAQDLVPLQPLAAPQVEELAQLPVNKGEEELAPPANKGQFVDCGQIGVNVLFMKEPAEAFQRAQAEKKTVFIVHLSGNLEDKDFT